VDMPRSLDKHPLLHVIWEDHASSDPWTAFADVDMTPAIVHSVGWKITENKNLLVLASNVRHNSEKCFALMYIIKSCIRHKSAVRSPLTRKLMKSA
jgi:hypothetical protein